VENERGDAAAVAGSGDQAARGCIAPRSSSPSLRCAAGPKRLNRRCSRASLKPRVHAGGGVETAEPSSARPIRWRTIGLRAFAALILACLVATIVYVSAADTFYIREPEIIGNHHIERETIRQAAEVVGVNIFWIHPRQVEERIRAIGGIKNARVHCVLPARVTIEVEERKPVILWRAEAQRKDFWLDEEGLVLPYPGVPTETVFVLDSSQRQKEIVERVEPTGIVQSALQVAASVPKVRLVYYQAGRGLSFTQKTPVGQWPVYVGDGSDLTRKMQVLQSLTEYLVRRKIQPRYVDIRWADYPVYGTGGN